jgi:IMP dehydrogenase/GMP reductase
MIEKFDWNDIAIIPAAISCINSRNEIDIFRNGKLPLITSPMDTVVDENNIKDFEDNGFNICLPRNIKYENIKNNDYFYSYGLDEIIELFESNSELPKKVLIDVANGGMSKLFDISRKIKEKFGSNIELMIGNIANPETYKLCSDIGVDYIRCGIGAGSACTTSINAAIHYPMASLISEINTIKTELKSNYKFASKVIADGGFKTFDDIIKALALGADYVMLGGVLNKSFESCGSFYTYLDTKESKNQLEEISEEEAMYFFDKNQDVYKKYRGMSTKEVQRDWNRKELKTSEGISKYNKIEYYISGWVENFSDYLKSNMSYCGKSNLEYYIGKVNYIFITRNAYDRYNK